MTHRVHTTATVAASASIGAGSEIWMWCQVRDNAQIGEQCILGKGVYVDTNVRIGKLCKIQNHASIFQGVTLEDGVFVGPHVCFTNDKVPRAINPNGTRKSPGDWTLSPTLVKHGASIGANATLMCGITIGRWAMIGAGAVVTRDVPDHGLVVGNPAVLVGHVCACGKHLDFETERATCGCGVRFQKQTAEVIVEV